MINERTKGTCYLLHFDRPFKHARHYLGWTVDLQRRMDKHLSGTGARLVEIITEEGIGFTLARTWLQATLRDEKRLKNRQRKKLCPLCRAGRNTCSNKLVVSSMW